MTLWLQRAKLWLEWLRRAKFWLIGGVIGALGLLIARVAWHANVAHHLLWLAETIERYGPAAGTVLSLILMWRRAGKKQVNGLAKKLEIQGKELADVRVALGFCEEARAVLLVENYLLLRASVGPPPDPPPGTP